MNKKIISFRVKFIKRFFFFKFSFRYRIFNDNYFFRNFNFFYQFLNHKFGDVSLNKQCVNVENQILFNRFVYVFEFLYKNICFFMRNKQTKTFSMFIKKHSTLNTNTARKQKKFI